MSKNNIGSIIKEPKSKLLIPLVKIIATLNDEELAKFEIFFRKVKKQYDEFING